jgi:hypothetical protein
MKYKVDVLMQGDKDAWQGVGNFSRKSSALSLDLKVHQPSAFTEVIFLFPYTLSLRNYITHDLGVRCPSSTEEQALW